MARLNQLPNLEQQISALLQSPKFKDLGNALKPLKPVVEKQPEEQPKPHKSFSLRAWLKTKQLKALDLFAGSVTFIIWLAISGWILQSFQVSYPSIIGLSVFWLFFIVVFRLMIGGLLD